MNQFIKILYDEHSVIVNAIDIAKQLKSLIGRDEVLYEKMLRQLIRFFREYADKFHHHKEELILFPEMNRRNELLEEGIVKEMFSNHEDFRENIARIEKALDEKKYSSAQSELEKYSEALLDHIAVENEEVFQMAEQLMDDSELEKIGYRFMDCDQELGNQLKADLEEMTELLRKEMMMID
jgi:hemerythrin-like domain-containing protein